MEKFSSRLKELRLENNLSQEKLAKLTNLSQASIAKWELKQRTPTLDNIITLCNFFKVSADYLIRLED